MLPICTLADKDIPMQTDLHQFLAHLAGTIVATLIPVVLIVFTVMPMNFHHHIGAVAQTVNAMPQHMT